MAIARDPGSRSKVAVKSNRAEVDPIGACLGPKSSRIANVTDNLRGEKVDIIRYDPAPATFISNALAPGEGDRSRTLRGRRRRSGHRSGLSALAGDRTRWPERSAGGAAHRLASRYRDETNRLKLESATSPNGKSAPPSEQSVTETPEVPVAAAADEIDAELDPQTRRVPARTVREGRGIDPLRTCVGCRGRFAQRGLVRFVRTAEGWCADTASRRKQPGRGAYSARPSARSELARTNATRGLARRRQNMV